MIKNTNNPERRDLTQKFMVFYKLRAFSDAFLTNDFRKVNDMCEIFIRVKRNGTTLQVFLWSEKGVQVDTELNI